MGPLKESNLLHGCCIAASPSILPPKRNCLGSLAVLMQDSCGVRGEFYIDHHCIACGCDLGL